MSALSTQDIIKEVRAIERVRGDKLAMLLKSAFDAVRSDPVYPQVLADVVHKDSLGFDRRALNVRILEGEFPITRFLSSKSAPLSSLLPSRTTRIFNMLTKEYISGEFAKHQMAEDLSQLGIAAKVIYDKHAGNLEFELKRAPQDISSSARALEN